MTFVVKGVRRKTRLGQYWANIQIRCSSPSHLARRPTYEGCENKFTSFQEFGDWATVQIGYDEHWPIDKDLLSKGSKVYSEDTCLFLPPAINSFLVERHKSKSGMPCGVTYNPISNTFTVSGGRIDRYDKALRFKTVEEAQQHYIRKKKLKAEDLANEYREKIDPRAYEALINYQPH
jgi:hypothetical protein